MPTLYDILTLLLALGLGAALWFPAGGWNPLLAGAVAAAWLGITALGVFLPRLGLMGRFIRRGRPIPLAALTFDDGPDSAATPALLDALDRLGAKAAFFLVGEKAAAHPGLVREIAARGHLVGNHSHRHAWWTNFLVGPALRREISRAGEALVAAGAPRPVHYRPPVGLVNPQLRSACRGMGLLPVLWSDGGRDRGRDPVAVARRVVEGTRPGAIILLHDGGADPDSLVRLVEAVAAGLREKGLGLARLDEMLRDPS